MSTGPNLSGPAFFVEGDATAKDFMNITHLEGRMVILDITGLTPNHEQVMVLAFRRAA